jgi:hypothetical protein
MIRPWEKGTVMDDFLSYEACIANMNTATLAGKVLKVEALTGKATGIAFTIDYQKHWPNGNTQSIPIRCYVTGADRLEKLSWLKAGEWVLACGEITDKGAVYAHQVEWLSRPPREPGEDDAYLAGVLESR